MSKFGVDEGMGGGRGDNSEAVYASLPGAREMTRFTSLLSLVSDLGGPTKPDTFAFITTARALFYARCMRTSGHSPGCGKTICANCHQD